jgi:hypothetical protein
MNNQNKYALLIGINKYSNLPPHYQLNGCINDIEMIASVLEDNFGFPESNITMLRDEEATREGILAAFRGLTDRIAENDIAVIHYSGHGSQIRDREGDEPDGWDETIVPHDSGRGSYPNRDITDDEIYVWLLELTEKTPHITLIFDCCNSGTISRDAFGTKSRWVEPDMRLVEELPPSPVLKKMMKVSSRDVGPSGWLPLSKRYVLIAGCMDNESSYEHNIVQESVSVSHGAMTYFLSRELTKAEPGATYRDIFERASVKVTAYYPNQHPQLEGARDRELFGVIDNQPMRFISVRERAGEKITLGAGAAHGMTVHSKWAIYPRATRQITKDTHRLGLVEITQVNAVTSYARISTEVQNGIIEANSRAVEEEHFYGQMQLKVEIRAPGKYGNHANKLSERIRKSALLSLVEAGETADVCACIIPSRTDVRKGDPVPQLKVVDKPVWAVVGQDGRLLIPIHNTDEASIVSIMCDNLEKVARYRQAIVLSNPDEESLLKSKVDFLLKRKNADGTWATAETDNAGGYIIFEEGEYISCEVINHHDSPIYISILDFGLTGAVTLFYPVAGANEPLDQGRSIQIGARQGDVIELFIPENFPYVLDPEDTMPIGGIETLKLFATTHEADFSPLIQQGFRSITKGGGKPLVQLLDMALTGHGTRDSRRNRVSIDEEWTTIEHSFFLQKKTHLYEKTRSVDRTQKNLDIKRKIGMEKPIQEPEELRFIQAQVFEHQQNEPRLVDNAFIEGEQYSVRVRIGPSDQSWLTLKKEFPQHLLPLKEKHTLQVFFSEPNHVPEVQTATIELLRRGPSNECQFFFNVKKQIPPFEGRIIIAHKNRIVQTALLKGEVVENFARAETRKSITLEMEAMVRPTIADLSGRPKFDLALLINQGSDNKHRLTKLAQDRASILDIEGIQTSIKNIQERLESASRAIADANIPEGVFRSEETETLLNFLAYHGRILYDAIITDQVDAGWLPRHIGRVQLVSAHAEAFLPLEFLYEKPAPSIDARLCPGSEQALIEGNCQDCLIRDDMTNVPYICPIGFWCLSRVIERHAHDASYGTMLGSSDYVMQSEPVDDRMELQVLRTCLYAASNRVDSVVPGQTKQFLDTLNSVSNNPGIMVSLWNDWAKEVASKHPTLLILMPHTLEDETLKAPVMEIGTSDRLVSGHIRPGYVCTSPEDQPPIVALLGCETMVPYSKYMGFVPQFRRNGAALVISTMTTVLGRHVVPIASKLMGEIKMELDEAEGHAISFGDVLLNVRRKMMLQGLPIVLCLIAFGDADWRLVSEKK